MDIGGNVEILKNLCWEILLIFLFVYKIVRNFIVISMDMNIQITKYVDKT